MTETALASCRLGLKLYPVARAFRLVLLGLYDTLEEGYFYSRTFLEPMAGEAI